MELFLQQLGCEYLKNGMHNEESIEEVSVCRRHWLALETLRK